MPHSRPSRPGLQHERRSAPCATADAHSGPSARQSPEPSSEESPPSPLVSLSDVTRHSPRQNASQQAKALRRWAILSVLSCDCRLLRANGDGRRRFTRICDCYVKSREGECVLHKTKKTLREERAGRRAPSGERRTDEMRRRSATRFGGKVAEGDRVATRERPRSAHAPRRTRGARSRLRGDEAPHVGKRQDAQQLIVAQGEKHLFMLKPGPRDSMMMTCARLQPPEAPNLLRGFVRNRP